MFKLKNWKKNFVVFLLTLAMMSNMLLGEWSGVITVHAEETLVSNGGFETFIQDEITLEPGYASNEKKGNECVDAWGLSTSSSSKYSMKYAKATDDGSVHGGMSALAITPVASVNEKTETFSQLSQTVSNLDAATTYEVSLWVKPINVVSVGTGKQTSSVEIILNESDSNTKVTGSQRTYLEDTWTELKVQTQPNADSKIVICIKAKNFTSGSWLIDDVTMRKITEPTIALSETTLDLEVGGTAALTATVTNPDEVECGDVVWSVDVDNEEIASVDTNGTVTGLKAGTATITATIKNSVGTDVTASCEVTVQSSSEPTATPTAAPATAVENISMPDKQVLYVGDSEILEVTFTPTNATNQTLTWSSSDSEVATVDATGKVTGVAVGTATITASSENGKSATCTVTVTETDADTDTGIVTMPNMLLNGDFEAIAGGLVHSEANNNITEYIVQGESTSAWKATNYWYDDASTIVRHTVGNIEGYDGGMALMISKDETMAADASIKRAAVFQTLDYEKDTTYIFKAKVKAVDVTGASKPYIALSVANEGGTNVELCNVTAADAGNDWYWLEGEYTFSETCTKTARINVYDLKSGYWLVDDVSLSRKPEEPKAVITQNSTEVKSVEVEIDKTAQLTAEMYDPDNVLGGETVVFGWSSADTAVATVDANGLVTAVGLGKTILTATSTDNTYVVACEIIVTEEFIELESISMVKLELNLCAGAQEKLDVTITPATATEQTLSWTSSDENVAKVDADGTVTGLGAGIATITATTTNDKTATCTVNVSVSTALTAIPVTLETAFGTPLTGDLTASVTNSTGNTASYKLFTAPENGEITVNTDGTFTYVPHTTSNTTADSFVVLVTAGEDAAILTGSITISSLSDSITGNLVSGSNLLFSKADLEAIKTAVNTEGTLQNETWSRYMPYLEGLLESTPIVYYQNDVDEWQRSEADKLVCLLIGYLITEDPAYKDKCLEYAKTIAEYDYWGVAEYWKQAELAAGHNAFALGLVYDWMKNEMSTELRDTILKRLYYACQCFEVSHDSRNHYMQNHTWICVTGLASATMAIYLDADYAVDVVKGDSDISASGNSVGNNVPDYDVDVTKDTLLENSERWLALVLDKIGNSYEWMPEDGTNHEGAGYAEYGTEWLLKASLLLEHNLGIDTFTGNGYLENHSEFFLNVIYPKNSISAAGSLINYADSERENWYGPTSHMRVLAAKYQDETAQWIAEVMEDANATRSDSFWMGLIWGDGSVEAKLDPEKSTLYYSENMGLAVARSDWSGDESLLFMRSGLPLGKAGNGLLTLNTSEYHVDPDCNAIILYSNGEYLLKTGGYTWKKTSNNSTLLINGLGQIGEGALGFVGDAFVTNDYEPTMTIIEDGDTYSYFVGDATEAYAPTANLNKFQRNVVFLKEENVVLVVDDIQSTQKSDLELRWFPESKTVIDSYGIYSAYGTNNTMNFYPFNTMSGDGVTTEYKAVDVYNRYNKIISEETFVQNYTGTSWQNAVAFSWTPNGEVATQVKYEAGNANEHKFEVNGKIYTLNVSANILTVEEGSLNQEYEWDTDSALANIFFNKNALEDFDSTTLVQDVERFWKTKEMTITAVPSSPTATTVIDWDGNCPGTVTITCTSGDKSSTTMYTINLKNDNGLLGIESASSTPNTKGISETCSYDNYIQETGDDRTWASQYLPIITYDMGTLVDISKIDVAFNKSRNRVTYYDLLISEDGENWTTILEDKTAEKTSPDLRLSEYLTIYDGEALRAQYVRVKLRGNGSSKDVDSAFNSIQEISFYGAVVAEDKGNDTEYSELQIIADATDTSYTLGSNKTVTISCTGEFEEFESVEMDGEIVAEADYTKEEGSTILTFRTEYLETLSVGAHTVTLNYTGDREITSALTIVEDNNDDGGTDEDGGTNGDGGTDEDGGTNGDSGTDVNSGADDDDDTAGSDCSENTEAVSTQSASAPTGDSSNPGLWIMLMLVSITGVAIMFVIKRRKN